MQYHPIADSDGAKQLNQSIYVAAVAGSLAAGRWRWLWAAGWLAASWLLAIGDWLLVACHWLPVAGAWLLAADGRRLTAAVAD